MATPLVLACDSADVDTTTGQCAHPVWVQQQSFFPELGAADGVTIGVAILTVWGLAFAYRSLRPSGDN